MLLWEKKIIVRAAMVVFICGVALSGNCFASDIEVSGIFLDAKGNKALINDDVYSEGETVSGVSIVKITEEGVVFSRDGQEFTQPLNSMPKPSLHLPSLGQKSSPAASSSSSSSSPSSSQSASSGAQTTSPNVPGAPMKTLYGMPIEKFFPSKDTLQKEMEDSMPMNALGPGAAAQYLKKAQEMQGKADARRQDIEAHIKEIEEN